MLRITVFGGLRVERGGERILGAAAQPRRMAVLAMVARAGGRGVSRDRLQATLWPEAAPDQGRHALKQAIYALRRDAGAAELFSGTRELHLNPDEVRSDVGEFEEQLRHGRDERAAALYAGPFLDGFRLSSVPEFEYWMEEERLVLERSFADALERLGRTALERGDAPAGVRWYRRLAGLDPVNAWHTVGLMQALLAAGDRAGALQQARIYEGVIAQEVDLPPDEAVLDLAKAIRQGRAVVGPPRPVVDPAPAAPVPSTEPAGRDDTGGGSPTAPPSPLAVAVLPFTSLAAPDDRGYLCDGLTEELISALGRRPELRVPGRISAVPLRDGAPDLAAIGGRFGVSAVVEGSVRSAGPDVRVTARLLRVADGLMLWTERFDRRLDHVLALQDEVAGAVADAVERALRDAAGLPSAPSARERANALYLEGIRAWTPQGGGLGQGMEHFREAVALDPGHARAHAALAESYTQLAFYGFLPAGRAATLAAAAADQALRLAPDLAESHLARGTCLLWVDRDFEAGTEELERALALDPALVPAQARLAFVRLCHDGPVEAERGMAERAATAAGATGLSRVMFGQQLLAARRFDEAIVALHAAIDIEAPSFLAYHWLTVAYVQQGLGAEAVAAAVAEASLSDRHPWALMSLVVACATAGQTRRAESLLDALTARAAAGHVQASVLAQAHAALGDIDTGMAFLERAVEEHDPSMMMLRAFPMFTPFHQHPGFRSLLHLAGWRDWDTAEFRIPTL